jgi:hypothetical protein
MEGFVFVPTRWGAGVEGFDFCLSSGFVFAM